MLKFLQQRLSAIHSAIRSSNACIRRVVNKREYIDIDILITIINIVIIAIAISNVQDTLLGRRRGRRRQSRHRYIVIGISTVSCHR